MFAIRQQAYGGPEVLELVDVERPRPRPTEVLVRVLAAGVNPIDWKARAGALRLPLPLTVGWDVAGVVEEVGPGVTRFRRGRAACWCRSPVRPRSPSRRSGLGYGWPRCWSSRTTPGWRRWPSWPTPASCGCWCRRCSRLPRRPRRTSSASRAARSGNRAQAVVSQAAVSNPVASRGSTRTGSRDSTATAAR